MTLPCDMIRDLLPLTEEGLCSAVTQEAVQEHLLHCPHCRRQAETVRSLSIPPVEADATIEVHALQTCFRRVRRRWGISLVAALLIFPLLFLSVNQARQQGICFSNMDELLLASRFATAMEQGKFSDAALLLDFERGYKSIQCSLSLSPEEHMLNRTAVTIGNEVYYASKEYLQYYSQDGAPETVWIEPLSAGYCTALIPLAEWMAYCQSQADIVQIGTDEFLLPDERVVSSLETQWGTYMVCDNLLDHSTSNDFTAAELCYYYDLIPQVIYQAALPQLQADAQEQYESTQAFYANVADMTVEEYVSLKQTEFAQTFEHLAELGYSIAKEGYREAYRTEDHWCIEYALAITYRGETATVTYHLVFRNGKISVSASGTDVRKAWLDDFYNAIFGG